MQKLVNKYLLYKGSIVSLCLWGLFFLCSACTVSSEESAVRLNDISFSFHYRSLDSLKVYSDSVINNYPESSDAYAEALNHLAFYHIGKMQYEQAEFLLRKVDAISNNHIELCIASVYNMRLCQRQSKNKEYYDYRQKALNHLNRLHEEDFYSLREQKRIEYAEAQFHFVSLAFEYYVSRTDDAKKSLHELDSLGYVHKDTALYLEYMYNIGSGGILSHSESAPEYVRQIEYDYLMRCYTIASEHSYIYWQANAMQAIAEHIISDGGEYFKSPSSMKRYVNTESVPDSLLAGNIAERALRLFRQYGDVYQTAAAWRTLSVCYDQIEDYHGSLYSLNQATKNIKLLEKAPALLASIYERFSIEYSAIGEKAESDYYRNLYLDLYDNTRLDRELEARAELLDNKIRRINTLIYIIVGLLVLLTTLLLWLVLKRRYKKKAGLEVSSKSFRKLKEENIAHLEQLDSEIEDLQEQCSMMSFQLSKQEYTYLEQQARIHHVNTLKPLLERMLHETNRIASHDEISSVRNTRINYVRELLTRINQDNDLLTRWIQIKRGEISLRIESFPLQDIFSILSKNTSSFSANKISYVVKDTDLSVKADKTLTLFMLNTLCDNARKHTPAGGTITVEASTVAHDMVEISVSDTGEGVDETIVAHIFDIKHIKDEIFSENKTHHTQTNHGFGLANCKGIIEKYKKTNSLFAHCHIGLENRTGQGARFFFRLPSGIRKKITLFVFLLSLFHGNISANNETANYEYLADSVYSCNIQRRHTDALEYAQQYLTAINGYYLMLFPHSSDTLLLYDQYGEVTAETRWLNDSVPAPYHTLLSVRNEITVAALALNKRDLYKYNNKAYSQLFRDCSYDKSLEDYCRRMERAKTDSNIAIALLILLVLSMLPIYYFAYYKHVIGDVMAMLRHTHNMIHEKRLQAEELQSLYNRLSFEYSRMHIINNIISNSLSTLKHETMYYPSRINQLINNEEYKEADQTARYYVEIYNMLANHTQRGTQIMLSAKTLFAIAKRIMATLSHTHTSDIVPYATKGPYVIFRLNIKMPDSHTPENSDQNIINLKILTQAARTLGEIYNLRRCGIVNTDNENTEVILPYIENNSL